MATLATDMPPLHSVDTVIGVTTPASAQSTSIGGTAGSGAANNSLIDSTQSPETKMITNTISSTNSQTNSNNTISAAADSSDNQPGTPQPHHPNLNDTQQNSSAAHHPYANHHIYSNSQPSTTTAANTHLNQMYPQHIYSQSNMDLQQQQQQQLQQPSSYPSYLNSYEQFYQQQQQQQQQNPSQASSQTQNPQQLDYINSNTNSLFAATDFKHQGTAVRYQPYLQNPTSANSQNSNANNPLDGNSQTAPVVSSATSSLMSPRVVSSTSPSSSSNQMQISGSASSISSLSAGNPSSPNSANTPQCKKCGIMCTNESELQEHITNVHGASPYGSSGYASSPYIKDEMQQTPPSQSQQQQQSATQQAAGHGANPGEILDLDSQKMLYPPTGGPMAAMIHQPLGNADPLHGLHSMQQRAGISPWEQQSQEGVPSYLQQPTESKNLPNHSPYYQSPKQSPYHVTNSTNVIKTEYQPIVKTEFTGDTQQYISDKSFDPTAPNQQQQQQMMPPAISSSPAEFPSTTTGGPQDNGQQNAAVNQQFRGGTFEPPSSSSAAIPSGPASGKAANWKSNEARRPKTYNCTACNKWFTSSGHLKRHYNTTLHKNAVKSSGQPDPATLPISVHHHPSRDPTGKTGRRGAAAAANAASVTNQQQQQQPNPVQPPEPPNSPQDYGGSQVAAGGLTPLSHYAATPSPNSMYQQQQQYQQHQYMPQAQSTSNSSPQHAASMVNHHHLQQQQQQQQQQQHQNQQQAVMNGHPNALAGPSVSPTRQQAPMPSSQMRGLLNSTMPTTRVHIVKSEHLEAALMQGQMHPNEEVQELDYLTAVTVKRESSEETPGRRIIYSPKANVSSQGQKEGELLEEQGSETVIQQLQAAEAPREVDRSVEHHHNTSQAPTPSQMQHYQLEQQHQLDMGHHYPNTTPNSPHNNMQLHSPLIISHQQYQEQLQQQQQQQTVAQGTYTLIQTPPPSPQQQQPHNIMGHQPYINMPLAINTQQPPNSMLPQQQPLTTTGRQPLPPATTIRTTNIVNMQPPSPHHMQPPQQQHMELQPLPNTQLQLDTINTNIPSHITTNNMPSYHQLQHPGSVLPPLDPTPNYPHTIIGNAEVLTVDAYGNLVSTSEQQLVQTADGQYLQFIPTGSTPVSGLYTTTQPSDQYIGNRTPQQGDLPPITLQYHQEPIGATMPCYSRTHGISNICDFGNFYSDHQPSPKPAKKVGGKRTKHPNSHIGPLNEVLPDGRIKCIPCKKTFSRICYLTQHNTSFHDGKHHFRCDKCGKRFKKYLAFVIHYAKHKCTDKAHKCHLCPKQFHHKTDLRRHIDAIHTGNKKHSCHICQKSFCRRDHLLKHIETHSRVRATGKRTKANATKANKNSKDLTVQGNNLIQMPLTTPEGILIINPNTSAPNSPTSTTNSLPSPLMMQNNFQNIQYSTMPNHYDQYMQPQYEVYEIVQQPIPIY